MVVDINKVVVVDMVVSKVDMVSSLIFDIL